jgi:hypothetical protein
MFAVGCGSAGAPAFVSNASRTPSSGLLPLPGLGLITGHVRDRTTLAYVAGVRVEVWLGAIHNGRSGGLSVSDEHGYFFVDTDPGSGFVIPDDSDGMSPHPFLLRAGEALSIDVTIDPAQLAESRKNAPPDTCPSSVVGTIVKGHSTSQSDLDDLVRAVLERSGTDEAAIPEGAVSLEGGEPILLDVEAGPRQVFTTRALPSTRYELRTRAELQQQAETSHKRVGFIDVGSVYSNGSCAMLSLGGDYVVPANTQKGMCCCVGYDVYEKRGSVWAFVRRTDEICP